MNFKQFTISYFNSISYNKDNVPTYLNSDLINKSSKSYNKQKNMLRFVEFSKYLKLKSQRF